MDTKSVWETYMEATKSGKFFKVKFIKRTTGEIRDMLCRTNVNKYEVGTGPAYSFSEKNLIPVWDVIKFHENIKSGMTKEQAGKKAYRSIPIENIIEISLTEGVTND